MPDPLYSDDYFRLVEQQSERSAQALVPVLVQLLQPGSVVDVGCGTGTWLASFHEHGVEDFLGMDGDWVESAALRIPEDRFEVVDLERPPRPQRRFDLVVSLEVAEHLPPQSADSFVELLTGLGPVVAFSAAIPGQGGASHVNERWPAYWSERFARWGYSAFDVIRPQIWTDDRIAWWFRQNLVLYVAEGADALAGLPQPPVDEVLPLVHPELFSDRAAAAGVPAQEPGPQPAPVAPPAPAPLAPTALQRLRSRVRLRTRLRALRNRAQRGPQRRRRILALVPVRDEMRYLPDLLENLQGQVDGVIALDDGSTDGSRGFLESHPFVTELRTVPPGTQEYMEDGRNHLALLDAAWGHDADWLLGIDADERLERDFRRRAEAEIDRAEAAGEIAFWVPFRQLWDSRDQVRMDGDWAERRKACLFKADRTAQFEKRRLHSIWAPWPPPNGEYPTADLRLYHLRTIEAEDRRARAERYETIDPDRVWQEAGYDHLSDEEGIRLEPIEPGREFVP
jgi:SAM-dependent methyltransferase